MITFPTMTNLSSITDNAPKRTDYVCEKIIRQVRSDIVRLRKQFHKPVLNDEAECNREEQTASYTIPKLQISLKSGPNGTTY